jgi:hypothetical protein
MAAERRNRSESRKAQPAASKTPRTALLHAKVLVSSYGAAEARDIARVNASLDVDGDPYWTFVLEAIGQIESSFPEP